MSEPEGGPVYTASAVAGRLGVSVGMVRRYALGLEAARGAELPKDPQRGRLYSEADVRLLERARGWVRDHPGGGVEDAVRAVLGLEPRAGESRSGPLALGPDAVSEAVARAIPEAMRPLLEELARERAGRMAAEADRDRLALELEGLRALPTPREAGSEAGPHAGVTLRAGPFSWVLAPFRRRRG